MNISYHYELTAALQVWYGTEEITIMYLRDTLSFQYLLHAFYTHPSSIFFNVNYKHFGLGPNPFHRFEQCLMQQLPPLGSSAVQINAIKSPKPCFQKDIKPMK